MKNKLLLSLCLACACCFQSLAQNKKEVVVIDTNYEMPTFDNPKAILIDKNSIEGKSSASIVRIVNYSQFKQIEIEVFVHSPLSSKWESLGTKKVAGFDTDVNFGKKYPQLSQYRYFAIVPKSINNKDDMQYKIEKKGGKLLVSLFNPRANIYAAPLPYHESPNAYVLTKKMLPRDANEDVILINMTATSVVSITVFAWDEKKNIWLRCFSISAMAGNSTKLDTEDDKVKYADYKYLAIVPADDKKYLYTFDEKHSDWYITVSDTFYNE